MKINMKAVLYAHGSVVVKDGASIERLLGIGIGARQLHPIVYGVSEVDPTVKNQSDRDHSDAVGRSTNEHNNENGRGSDSPLLLLDEEV